MRVTGTVKKYIEKRVREIYKQKLDELADKIKVARENETTLRNDITSDLKGYAKRLLLANNCAPARLGTVDESGFASGGYVCGWHFSTPYTTLINETEKERQLIEIEIREKIDEIIISVELGGTKATLEEEIAKLNT